MERCPPELLTYIFAFACSDGGRTGRQLSRVSRYIRAVCASVRMRSIALYSVEEICRFADALEAMSSQQAKTVRVLDIAVDMIPAPFPLTGPHREFNIPHALELGGCSAWPPRKLDFGLRGCLPRLSFDFDTYYASMCTRAHIAENALRFILATLAPNLLALALWLHPAYERTFAFLPRCVEFPELRYFTFRGERMPIAANPHRLAADFAKCPALQDITLVWSHVPTTMQNLLVELAPSLRSLRVVCRSQVEVETLRYSGISGRGAIVVACSTL